MQEKEKNKIKELMNKLGEYLRVRGTKHIVFAEKIGTSTTTLHNILKKGLIPSLPIAIEIEKKTKGVVSVYDWDSTQDQEESKTHKNNHKHD